MLSAEVRRNTPLSLYLKFQSYFPHFRQLCKNIVATELLGCASLLLPISIRLRSILLRSANILEIGQCYVFTKKITEGPMLIRNRKMLRITNDNIPFWPERLSLKIFHFSSTPWFVPPFIHFRQSSEGLSKLHSSIIDSEI